METNLSFQNNQRKEFDVRRGDRSNIPANSLSLSTQIFDLTLLEKTKSKRQAKYGFTILNQVNSNEPGTGIRPLLPNYNRNQIGAFISQEIHLKNWLIETGIRYDYEYNLAQKFDRQNNLLKPIYRFSIWSASAGITYTFTNNIQLSSLLAYAHRPPHISELLSEGLHHGAATIEEGDPSLNTERSLNWSNTLSLNYPKKLKIELTGYINPITDFIYLQPQPEPRLTIRGAFPVYNYTQSDALLRGIDFSIQWFINEYFSYAFQANSLRANHSVDNTPLILIPSDRLNHNIEWSKKAATGKFNEFFVRLSHEIVSRQSRFPVNQDLSDPPPGYQLFNLNIGTQLKLKASTLGFQFGVDNMFNKSYRNYLDRQRYFADSLGRNLILKINYEF